jgi:hypothetical protein
VNDQDILTCAEQAAVWLFGRRERLEKHEHELATLLWLSVSEIEAIIDSFDALEAVHGLTVDERKRSHCTNESRTKSTGTTLTTAPDGTGTHSQCRNPVRVTAVGE